MSCKDCKKRVVNCHSTCLDYLSSRTKLEEIKTKQKSDREYYGYIGISAKENREKRLKRLNLTNDKYGN